MSSPLEIKEAVERTMLNIPGVTGIGIGRNSPESIIIYLKSECPKITCNIPEEIGGVPVKTIVTGTIRPLNIRTDRSRPAFPGISIGHYAVTAGTFGAVCYDNDTGEMLLLSNNHVFANENDALEGDAILQPGVVDGGRNPEDQIATLKRYIPIDRDIVNQVDCAVAKPLNPADISDSILIIGQITQMCEPEINDLVEKSGRTTGFSEGKIVDVNATISVNYGKLGTVRFKDQIIISPSITAGGDSGSLLVRTRDLKAVGLVFAGAQTISVCNRISIVAQALNIRFSPQILPAPICQESIIIEEPKGSIWGPAVALAAMPLLFIRRGKKK